MGKAGVQPEGGWRVFGYFLHEQKVPRPWVREPTKRRAASGPVGSPRGGGKWRGRPLLFLCAAGNYSAVSSSFLVTIMFSSSSCFCAPTGWGIPRGPLTGFDLRGASKSPLAPRFCPLGKTLERRRRRPALRGPVEQKAKKALFGSLFLFLGYHNIQLIQLLLRPHGMGHPAGTPDRI